ncbi:MAG: protein kinase domain-containing protein [Actinomycetales bacterium]
MPELLAGRYKIGRLLGRGGMAVVHLGDDTRLNRQVAIKLLRLDLADDITAQTRFRREAQSAASLNHPSIVAVFDTGEDTIGGMAGATHTIPFIVMEYVQGLTLREMLQDARRNDATATIALPPSGRGAPSTRSTEHGVPLDIDQAVAITAHVLAALGYSHSMGIVHRDIKPGNVMVTPSGAVKVMDFGIARALSDTSATMTSTQTVVGTAQYLSPEQAKGEQVDARSDLYSTGAMLYELLTGRPPFVGDTPVAVAYQHVREAPQPPSHYNPAIGDELDRVVMHALAKDRNQRYQSADAFSEDLLNALDGRPVDAPPTAVMTRAPAPMPAAPLPGPTSTVLEDLDAEEPRKSRAGYWIAMILALILMVLVGWFAAARLLTTPTPELVAVPTVTGMDRNLAEQAITDAGFAYEEGTPVADDQIPLDAVVSQDPAGGIEAETGSTVTVTLSSGSETVTVPDMAGKTQQEARDALEATDLKVGNVETVESQEVAKGLVVSTDPPAGSQLARQSEVNISVSSGLVSAPDVTGQTLERARSTLSALGFKVSTDYVTTTANTAGTVISQNPGAGAIEAGSTITLQVARAPVVTPSTTSSTSSSPSTTTGTPSEGPTTSITSDTPAPGD